MRCFSTGCEANKVKDERSIANGQGRCASFKRAELSSSAEEANRTRCNAAVIGEDGQRRDKGREQSGKGLHTYNSPHFKSSTLGPPPFSHPSSFDSVPPFRSSSSRSLNHAG